MREPPRLAEETIKVVLQAHYAISDATISFLPIGNDSASAVYRILTVDGVTYFLKVRIGQGFSPSSLAIPHYLHDRGVPHIVAPLPTVTQTLWVGMDDFALSLYPYIDGRTGTDVGLTERHWRTLGRTLKQIHTIPLPPELMQILPRESFAPSRRGLLTELEAVITQQDSASSAERELAAFWRARQDKIRALADQADILGHRLRQAPPLLPHGLCHADLHTWNVLLDRVQQLWLVDWDETILAPRERDLMFVVGGIGRDLVSPQETTCFLQGYGSAAINPLALAYYRYAWAVQDMIEYGERVLLFPNLSRESRRDALHGFMSLFEPGNIVDIAFASDNIAP